MRIATCMLALLLAFSVMVGLGGCGRTTEEEGGTTTTTTAAPTTTTTTTTTTMTTTTTTAAPTTIDGLLPDATDLMPSTTTTVR